VSSPNFADTAGCGGRRRSNVNWRRIRIMARNSMWVLQTFDVWLCDRQVHLESVQCAHNMHIMLLFRLGNVQILLHKSGMLMLRTWS
jgi:hypothetical protein